MAAKPSTKQSPLDESKKFVRMDVAAQRWDVHVDAIRRLIASGQVTGYRLNGRIIRVDQAEVDSCFRPIPTLKNA